jgi:hypothetical protein
VKSKPKNFEGLRFAAPPFGASRRRLAKLDACRTRLSSGTLHGSATWLHRSSSVKSRPLIALVNPLSGWGHGWARKMISPIPNVCNAIKARGGFEGRSQSCPRFCTVGHRRLGGRYGIRPRDAWRAGCTATVGAVALRQRTGAGAIMCHMRMVRHRRRERLHCRIDAERTRCRHPQPPSSATFIKSAQSVNGLTRLLFISREHFGAAASIAQMGLLSPSSGSLQTHLKCRRYRSHCSRSNPGPSVFRNMEESNGSRADPHQIRPESGRIVK